MTMLMILHGGPLDGQEQICQALNTTPGSYIFLNVPNHQYFAPDGVTVIDQGIEVEYALGTQGPPPGTNDTWATSWNFTFIPESFVPLPPPITPTYPVLPDITVTMTDSVTNLTVSGDWSPGVAMADSVTSMQVDADTTGFVDSSGVAMEGDTYMAVTTDWWVNSVLMGDSVTTMTITGLVNGQ